MSFIPLSMSTVDSTLYLLDHKSKQNQNPMQSLNNLSKGQHDPKLSLLLRCLLKTQDKMDVSARN